MPLLAKHNSLALLSVRRKAKWDGISFSSYDGTLVLYLVMSFAIFVIMLGSAELLRIYIFKVISYQ